MVNPFFTALEMPDSPAGELPVWARLAFGQCMGKHTRATVVESFSRIRDDNGDTCYISYTLPDAFCTGPYMVAVDKW